MNKEEQKEIQERIKSIPKGNISIKTINGRKYEYWQFREDGKQISRRVKGIELEALRGQIEERKRLESMLKKEKNGIVENIEKYLMSDEGYHGQVRTGKELKAFAMTVKGLKKRGCFSALTEYIYGDGADRDPHEIWIVWDKGAHAAGDREKARDLPVLHLHHIIYLPYFFPPSYIFRAG